MIEYNFHYIVVYFIILYKIFVNYKKSRVYFEYF